MKRISDILGKSDDPKHKKGGINSLRSYTVEQVMIFMHEDPKNSIRFRYWLGRTRKIPPQELYRMMSEAKEGRNPQALFNWHLKKYGEKKG